MLCSGALQNEYLNYRMFLYWPRWNGRVGQKMLYKFLWQVDTTIFGIHAYVWWMDWMLYHELVKFCQLPNCNLFTQNLFILFGEIPLVKLWTPVHLLLLLLVFLLTIALVTITLLLLLLPIFHYRHIIVATNKFMSSKITFRCAWIDNSTGKIFICSLVLLVSNQ